MNYMLLFRILWTRLWIHGPKRIIICCRRFSELFHLQQLFIGPKSMVNILAKNAYFFPPPSSQGPYFFPVFAASHDTNMSQICGRSARSAKFLPFLPHIWQIALKIDLKQCNLGKFSLFCVSNFRVRSLFLPHFSRMLISSPLPRGGRCWPEYIPLSKIEQKVTQEMQWIMNYMLLFRIWDQKSTTTINCIQNDSVET